MRGLAIGLRRLWTRIRYSDYSVAEYFRSLGAEIGTGTRLLIRDLGSEPYLVSIGDDTLVSSGVVTLTHDGAVWVLKDRLPKANRFDRVRIGSRCFIGARTTLLPGASVGDDTVIGAGSVVIGAIPSGVVAAGVPARVIRPLAEWEADIQARSLDLPDELFPLSECDRALLKTTLERLLPLAQDGGGE